MVEGDRRQGWASWALPGGRERGDSLERGERGSEGGNGAAAKDFRPYPQEVDTARVWGQESTPRTEAQLDREEARERLWQVSTAQRPAGRVTATATYFTWSEHLKNTYLY